MTSKLILTLALTLGTLFSKAQITKGKFFIESFFSYTDRKQNNSPLYSFTKTTRITEFSVAPSFGFFISNNLSLGVALIYTNDYARQSDFGGTEGITRTNIYSINPYIRKYFRIKDNLYFTLTGNVVIGSGQTKFTYMSGSQPTTNSALFEIDLNSKPGIVYFINNRWTTSITLGSLSLYEYEHVTNTDKGALPKDSNRKFGPSFEINSVAIGVQYFFGH
jgi:hypothetical protein